MDWMSWLYTLACVVMGYGIHGWIDEARYGPRPKHKWACPHCPLKIAASDKDILEVEARKHHDNRHPGVHS